MFLKFVEFGVQNKALKPQLKKDDDDLGFHIASTIIVIS